MCRPAASRGAQAAAAGPPGDQGCPGIIPRLSAGGAPLDTLLWVKAAVMGIVEGLTEFLPISSTGHLILAGSLLNFTGEAAKVFDIAIQSGAIFAVILVYWQRVRDTAAGLGSDPKARRFALNVAIGFLPAAVMGVLFNK